MDSTTKARVDTRELTSTEIEIAAAQIIDRMTRYVKAISEIEKRDAKNDDGVGIDDLRRIAQKFEIPAGVCLTFGESYGGTYIAEFKPWVKRWVSGSLTEADVHDMNFYFDVLNEMDHCWIFMEKPSYYYGGGISYHDGDESNIPVGFDFESQMREWAAVGIRSPRKYRGASFADVFLKPEGFDSVFSNDGMAAACSIMGNSIDTRAELIRSDGKRVRVPRAALKTT